jgi:pimeloyl-ACP methyl ester carboxylesterase
MARTLAMQGIGSVVVDHLACGKSSSDIPTETLRPEDFADAYAHLTHQLRARLEAGTLIAGIPPLLPGHLWLTAVGHSFGGRVITLAQSTHACFDALALLGSPSNDEYVNLAQFGIGDEMDCTDCTDYTGGTGGTEGMGGMETIRQAWLSQADAGLITLPREYLRPFFYGETDIPPELIEVDEADAVPIPLGLLSLMRPNAVREAARTLTCPLFVGFGESDITACPRSDPAAYESAMSITLYVQPDASHYTNFAPTRTDLWKELASWCRAQAVLALGYRSPGLFGWPHLPLPTGASTEQDHGTIVVIAPPEIARCV